jgi:hypothetical protein
MRYSGLVLAGMLLASIASADVFEASFDKDLAAQHLGQPLLGELLPGAEMAAEGLRGGGLRVSDKGGAKFRLPEALSLKQGALQLWVKPSFGTRDAARHWLVCDSQARFKIFKHTDGNTYFQLRTDTGGVHAKATVSWIPDQWQHLGVTWTNLNSGTDNGLLQLWINGSVKATLTGNFPVKSFGDTLFVGCDEKGQESAASLLDELRISAEPRMVVDFPEGLAPGHDPRSFALSTRGARVTASSELLGFKGKDYPASAMIDGEVSGVYWASDFIRGTAKGDQWLEVELARPERVGRISLYMVSSSPKMLTDKFRLFVWANEGWHKVADEQNYTKLVEPDNVLSRYSQAFGVYTATFTPLTTQKVRLEIPGTTVRLHEIEVLPPATEAAPMKTTLAAAGPVYQFDFGTNASPVAKGWLPVTNTTLYSDSAGCGWQSADNIVAVDRSTGDPVKRDFLAAARADNAPVSNTFTIKLPNGQYALGLVSGDSEFDFQPFSISANGKRIATDIATADRAEARVTRSIVNVTTGKLDLTFAGAHSWLVNAVVVAPVTQLEQVNAALTEAVDAFAIGAPELLSGLREIKPDAPAKVAAPTATDMQRGYQVFARGGYLGTIYRDEVPAAGESITELKLAATPGEYEPASFTLHALQTLQGARVEVSELKGPGTIPASAWTVRAVEYMPQRFKMSVRDGWAVMPEILRPQDHWGDMWLSTGKNQQYWLTVQVPAEAAPGDYAGEVTIRTSAGTQKLPLQLTVYPFKLTTPKNQNLGIYYYAGTNMASSASGADRIERLVLADLRDMREHGLNFVVINLPGEAINWTADPVTFDLSHLQWMMKLTRQVGGFDGVFPIYMGGAWKADRPDAVQVVQNLIKTIETERKAQGWPEFLYYLVDEPFGGQKLEDAVAPYQAARGVPGVRTYCTVSGAAGERLAPWLDVRCHATSGSTGYYWPEVYDKAMADKDEYWWYSNCTREFPAVMRFKAGFHHIKSKATGQTYWHYRNLIGSGFCDFDGGPGDYVTSYPGVDGPVATIQWECHREGLDDAKYVWALETLIAQAAQSDRPETRAAGAEAARVLAQVREQTIIDLRHYEQKYGSDLAFHYVSEWPPGKYDEMRRTIVEQILKLRQPGLAL